MTDPLWRMPRVLEETGLSRSALYRHIDAGRFPKPKKLGPRTNVWPASQVEAAKAQLLEHYN